MKINAIRCKEIDSFMPYQYGHLPDDLRKKFIDAKCCRCGKDFESCGIKNEDIMYVECENGEIRFWCYALCYLENHPREMQN